LHVANRKIHDKVCRRDELEIGNAIRQLKSVNHLTPPQIINPNDTVHATGDAVCLNTWVMHYVQDWSRKAVEFIKLVVAMVAGKFEKAEAASLARNRERLQFLVDKSTADGIFLRDQVREGV
jgi:hypothetical protein